MKSKVLKPVRVITPAASKGSKMKSPIKKSIASQKPVVVSYKTPSKKGSAKYSEGPYLKSAAVTQRYHSEGSAAAKSLVHTVIDSSNDEDDDLEVARNQKQFSKSKGGTEALFDTGDMTEGKTGSVSKIELERSKNRKKRAFFKKKN